MENLKKAILIFIIGSIPFFYFCKSPKDIVQKEFELQQVHDTIAYLDLSHKGLKELPKELENMYVRKLNLSYNNLKTVDFEQLPYALEEVNISHNELNGKVIVKKRDQVFEEVTVHPKVGGKVNNNREPIKLKKQKLYFKKIDLSYNKIDSVYVRPKVLYINISNNNLTHLFFNTMGGRHLMDTLNISDNRDFDNVVLFEPQVFKEIHRKNIKNNKPLKFRGFLGGAGCTAEDIFIKSKE